jgi:hypothetical protein
MQGPTNSYMFRLLTTQSSESTKFEILFKSRIMWVLLLYNTHTHTHTKCWTNNYWLLYFIVNINHSTCRSQWWRGLRRRSTAARLLRTWVRIPPGVWMFVCCVCCVLSGRGLYDELITCPEESYRLWCVVVCDHETSWYEEAIARDGLQNQREGEKKNFRHGALFCSTNAIIKLCCGLNCR